MKRAFFDARCICYAFVTLFFWTLLEENIHLQQKTVLVTMKIPKRNMKMWTPYEEVRKKYE